MRKEDVDKIGGTKVLAVGALVLQAVWDIAKRTTHDDECMDALFPESPNMEDYFFQFM